MKGYLEVEVDCVDWFLVLAGVLSALGAFAFIVNIWRTIDGPGVLSRVAQVQQARRLPLQ